ncbi:MAG: acyl carrier protein [Alphaproteobacteria bacterium]
MTDAELAALILAKIAEIAPEADIANADPAMDLRDQFDLDSMDFLNFAIALHEALGVEIPETDYPRMRSLDAAVAYLREKSAT